MMFPSLRLPYIGCADLMTQDTKNKKRLTMVALMLPTLFILAGCQSSNPQISAQSARDIANAEAAADVDVCRRKYPAERKTIVDRAKCLNAALQRLVPYDPYPDITQVFRAYTVVVAEQFRDGKLSESEANMKIAEKRTQLASESQRRLATSNPPVQSIIIMPMPMPTPVPMTPYRLPCPPGPYNLACRI
jgi:hypothetical protein